MPHNTETSRFMVANVTIDYLAQAYYPAKLDCLVAALPGGRTSWTMQQLLLQGGKPVAAARAAVVCTDGQHPVTMDPELRERLVPWLIR
jgi:acyl-CoA thioester hydrolase